MKFVLFVTTLLISVTTSAAEITAGETEPTDKFANAKQAALKQAESPESKRYFNSMAEFWQTALNQSGRSCKAGVGDGVELVLTINEKGKIEDIIGSPWNDKCQCYARIISKQRAPRPPEHPFYLSTVMP